MVWTIVILLRQIIKEFVRIKRASAIHAKHAKILIFAQIVRDIIVEWKQEGKAIAKQQREDFREGRPNKFTKKQIAHALKLLESNSYKHVEILTGISKSTLIRAKKQLETMKVKCTIKGKTVLGVINLHGNKGRGSIYSTRKNLIKIEFTLKG